jgi:hypothetical protein
VAYSRSGVYSRSVVYSSVVVRGLQS